MVDVPHSNLSFSKLNTFDVSLILVPLIETFLISAMHANATAGGYLSVDFLVVAVGWVITGDN